jgi:hypothetical protein
MSKLAAWKKWQLLIYHGERNRELRVEHKLYFSEERQIKRLENQEDSLNQTRNVFREHVQHRFIS